MILEKQWSSLFLVMCKEEPHRSSVEQEIQQIQMSKPHVVILGAGASYAAFPNGDKNEVRLPLMNNFVDILGLNACWQSLALILKPKTSKIYTVNFMRITLIAKPEKKWKK